MQSRTLHPILRLALSAILLAVLALNVPPAAAAQPPRALPAGLTLAKPADLPAAPQIALGSLLNPDGSLNLPAEGIPGSIDPAGFALVSGPGEAPRFAPSAPGDENWVAGFNLPGMNDYVLALAWDGTNLYAGGAFTSAEGVVANRIVRWDGVAWHALGSGIDGDVYALAWDGANLYAGGEFATAGGVSANRIARWDGTAWSALGSGMNHWVSALAWDGTNLYPPGVYLLTASPAGTAAPGMRWAAGRTTTSRPWPGTGPTSTLVGGSPPPGASPLTTSPAGTAAPGARWAAGWVAPSTRWPGTERTSTPAALSPALGTSRPTTSPAGTAAPGTRWAAG